MTTINEKDIKINLNQKSLRREVYNRKVSKQRSWLNRKKIRRSKFVPHAQGYFQQLKDIAVVAKDVHEFVEKTKVMADTLRATIESKSIAHGRNKTFDLLLKRIETIISLCVALYSQQSISGAIATITLFLNTWCDNAVVPLIIDKIVFMLSVPDPLHPQSDDGSSGDFSYFRDAITRWKEFRHSIFAKKIMNLISIVVTCGFFPTLASEGIKVGGFEVFSARVWDIQGNCTSFFESVVETMFFFIQRGYYCFRTGDFSSLLYDELEMHRLDMTYSTLVSCFPLVESGRFEETVLLNAKISDGADYIEAITDLVKKFETKLKKEKSDMLRNVFNNKIMMLRHIQEKYIHLMQTSCVREKPFSVLIYGPSSIGKTHITQAVAKSICAANGIKCSADRICTLNDADKYHSEYYAHHNVVIFDDMLNGREDQYDTNPLNKIIDFINNVPKAALKAGVNEKGNIMIQPKIVIVTTNVKDLKCCHFSNEPVSIMRRFDMVIDVTLKESATAINGSLNPKCMYDRLGAPLFAPDVWDLQLQEVRIHRKNPLNNVGRDEFTFHNLLQNANLMDVLKVMHVRSKEHFDYQKKFVSQVKDLYNTPMCEHHFCSTQCPECAQDLMCQPIVEDEVSVPPEIFVEVTKDPSVSWVTKMKMYFQGKVPESYALDISDSSVTIEQLNEEVEVCMKALELGPQTADLGYEFLASFDEQEPESIGSHIKSTFRLLCLPVKRFVVNSSLSCVSALKFTIEGITKCAYVMLGLTAFAGVIFATYKLVKHLTKLAYSPQMGVGDTFKPTPFESEVENIWKKVVPISLKISEKASTTTVDDLKAKIKHNLGTASLVGNSNGQECCRRCNIFPICKTYWVIPTHALFEDDFVITVSTTGEGELGRNFKARINQMDIYPIYDERGSSDLSLIRLLNGGPNYDFLSFFPIEKFSLTTSLVGTLITRNGDRTLTDITVTSGMMKSFHNEGISVTGEHFSTNFYGMCYRTSEAVTVGMCASPIIAERNNPCILGFHLAGNDKNAGACQLVTVTQLEDAVNSMDDIMYSPHSRVGFEPKRYDIVYQTDVALHERHCINFLCDNEDGDEPCIEFLGNHGLRTTFISQVKKLPISDTVDEVMELERMHGAPPRSKINVHWARDIAEIAHTKGYFDRECLYSAVEDLSRLYDSIMDQCPEQLAQIRPYDKDVVLAGCNGVRSVEAVDRSTSMGFPIYKPKSNYITLSERIVPGIEVPLDLDETIYNEILVLEKRLSEGERVNFVFKGNLKDEPVKFTKNKIRIFCGSEFALTFLVRKYYLPIIRFIQSNWLEAECAVGINAYGPSWDVMVRHLQEYGDDFIVGDYKAYDKCMPAEISWFSFLQYIRIAERAGYCKDDVQVMLGLATECCYPLYDYDGVFFQAYGSNPSGHPLTVILNSDNNKILSRYAYYKAFDNDPPADFCEKVRFQSYGDDNCHNPKSDIMEKYNHVTIAEYLAEAGIIYTMADKSDFILPSVDISKASFLKRAFKFDSEYGAYVAPIEEASIQKFLHNYMKRKHSGINIKEICANAVMGAAREYALHGRRVYENRIIQLTEICVKHGLQPFVNPTMKGDLFPSFDVILDRYHGVKYNVEDPFEDFSIFHPHVVASQRYGYQGSVHALPEASFDVVSARSRLDPIGEKSDVNLSQSHRAEY